MLLGHRKRQVTFNSRRCAGCNRTAVRLRFKAKGSIRWVVLVALSPILLPGGRLCKVREQHMLRGPWALHKDKNPRTPEFHTEISTVPVQVATPHGNLLVFLFLYLNAATFQQPWHRMVAAAGTGKLTLYRSDSDWGDCGGAETYT